MIRTQRFRLRGVHYLYDESYMEPRHGHEYFLEVSVDAEVPRDQLEMCVDERVLQPWDRQDWNTKGLAQASGELLVERFDEILRESLGESLVAVVLRETRKNRFVSSQSDLAYCD